MSNLIIYGLGDFAKMMKHYFTEDSPYKVVAFCADKSFIKENNFNGLPVVPFEEVDSIYPNGSFLMFVAVGYSSMRIRQIMFEKAKAKNYTLVNYISSQATIEKSVAIGDNNVILQGSQIEPFCIIGNNNIIWSSVNISHDCTISNHCFIASQSLIGGNSTLHDGCFLGFNSTILQNIELSQETLVGTKSLITTNTKSFSKNIGIPAKLISTHTHEGIKIK